MAELWNESTINLRFLKKRLRENPKEFIKVSEILSLPNDILSQIIKHNERIITEKELELQKLKDKIDTVEWIFLSLDYPLPSKEIIEEIKKEMTVDDLQKTIKKLKKKEFTFFTPSHPSFLEILQNTNEQTLSEISREINDKKLPIQYLENHPNIMTSKTWKTYLQNKDTVLLNHLHLSFFHLSDFLLRENAQFIEIIELIKKYRCTKIPCYDQHYFDEIDALIEKRFDLEENIAKPIHHSTTFVMLTLKNLSPTSTIGIEQDENIIWMDEQFMIDP
ncbi:MAG: hypothetical protein HFI09_05140, partial [Bacilli bacterium]|nr:hypothetical protein [Bacilli bacterium]